MKIKAPLTILLSSISFFLSAQTNLPFEFKKFVNNQHFTSRYRVTAFLKPSYLQADFNKDGIKDAAILISEKATKKRGVIIIHGLTKQYFILGAGTQFGNGGDDFSWLKGWSLYNQNFTYETTFNKESDILGAKKIKLRRPAFFIHDLQDGAPTAGGVIYWTGKKYIWIHQGE